MSTLLNQKIYATFDGGEGIKNLPGLCLELLSEQKKSWQDLREGYESLEKRQGAEPTLQRIFCPPPVQSRKDQEQYGRCRREVMETSGHVSSAWIISPKARKESSTGANT